MGDERKVQRLGDDEFARLMAHLREEGMQAAPEFDLDEGVKRSEVTEARQKVFEGEIARIRIDHTAMAVQQIVSAYPANVLQRASVPQECYEDIQEHCTSVSMGAAGRAYRLHAYKADTYPSICIGDILGRELRLDRATMEKRKVDRVDWLLLWQVMTPTLPVGERAIAMLRALYEAKHTSTKTRARPRFDLRGFFVKKIWVPLLKEDEIEQLEQITRAEKVSVPIERREESDDESIAIVIEFTWSSVPRRSQATLVIPKEEKRNG